MASDEKLDRVERPSTTVLGLPLREHRGREEGEGNSFPSFAWPGKGSRTTVRGGAIADPPEHAVTALRCTKTWGKSAGESGGAGELTGEEEGDGDGPNPRERRAAVHGGLGEIAASSNTRTAAGRVQMGERKGGSAHKLLKRGGGEERGQSGSGEKSWERAQLGGCGIGRERGGEDS